MRYILACSHALVYASLKYSTFLQSNLVEFLERSADLLAQAERYEVTGEIYKLVIPVYEQERDFNVRLMNSYAIVILN